MPFDEWTTPPDIINKARLSMGSIDLDPASNTASQDIVKARTYHDIYSNGLLHTWLGNVWLNPPYSKGNIDSFSKKAIQELSNVQQMMILVNSQTDTRWYHNFLQYADFTLLFKGRIKFWKVVNGKALSRWESSTTGKLTNAPRYLNTLFCYKVSLEAFREQFESKGTIIVTSKTTYSISVTNYATAPNMVY